MRPNDLFNKCGLIMNEDANEGQRSLNTFNVDTGFDFWTLEGWLNWLSSKGIKGKRIIKNSNNLKNIVLIDGSKLGDAKNKSMQMAVIGQNTNGQYKNGLKTVFKMAVDKMMDEMIDEGFVKEEITLKDIFKRNPPKKQSMVQRFFKPAEDKEDKGDVCLKPDTFDKDEKELEIPDAGSVDGSFKSKEDIEKALEIKIPNAIEGSLDSPTSVSVVRGVKEGHIKKPIKRRKNKTIVYNELFKIY